jgi:putative NADH-flavin reductase
VKLVVLGASGGTGRELVVQAVERGHTVVAVGRPSSKLESLSDAVRVERGDLSSVPFLRGAMAGADVVLSALGLRTPSLAPWARPEVPDFLDTSTQAIVEAMRAEGLRRVAAVSAGGAGDSRDQVPGFFKAMMAVTSLKTAYAALDRMEAIYLASGLEVCLVRPPGLTNGPRTAGLRVVEGFPREASVSRADVASFLLDQAERPAFTHATATIGHG